ncbi:hypothetical protein V6N13_133113 [Hibiscus sabdariffa]|uniref:Pectinesterase inhibitor domain-containing protein n=1 Tax=Hibiscus sabdariffa TaxID=183260 RepID=A0ABR2PXH2_9ROSI
MLMANANIYYILLLLLSVLKWGQVTSNYVQDTCNVTPLYHHTGTVFQFYQDKSKQVGASRDFGNHRRNQEIAHYLMEVKKYIEMRGRYKISLSDCIEYFQNAIDQLHSSLGVLRNLSARNFYAQMGDVTTWLSAAPTHKTPV